MKNHSSRIPDNARDAVPMILGEGRRLIQQSARRAGRTASKVARSGRRLIGDTVHETERMTRRHPLAGLGAAVGTGFILGGLCAFVFYRARSLLM
jgi:ElaB/YqjD/DUF883 family membrane-anchored ribosome-binding protein